MLQDADCIMLSCKSQLDGLHETVDYWTDHAQEFIDCTCTNNNNLEGLHGLMLYYRNKHIPIQGKHYNLKTNLAILHKVNKLTCRTDSTPLKNSTVHSIVIIQKIYSMNFSYRVTLPVF